jgi:hypothetical protein
MPHIVIGIDGTNSHVYKTRWVEEFVNSVQAERENKLYLPGPTELLGSTGRDCEDLYIRAGNFLAARLAAYGLLTCRIRETRGVTITFVGHSRGGHTVIALARDCMMRVDHLFLYDAVDMSWVLGETGIIRNVDYAFHAMRSPRMRSRESWGNTGTDISGGILFPKYFETNHGGMGGDVGDTAPNPVMGDDSCIYRPPMPHMVYTRGMAITIPAPSPTSIHEENSGVYTVCANQSAAVHQWIKAQAYSRGLRFLQ